MKRKVKCLVYDCRTHKMEEVIKEIPVFLELPPSPSPRDVQIKQLCETVLNLSNAVQMLAKKAGVTVNVDVTHVHDILMTYYTRFGKVLNTQSVGYEVTGTPAKGYPILLLRNPDVKTVKAESETIEGNGVYFIRSEFEKPVSTVYVCSQMSETDFRCWSVEFCKSHKVYKAWVKIHGLEVQNGKYTFHINAIVMPD